MRGSLIVAVSAGLAATALATPGALVLNAPLSVREAGMGQVSVGGTDILRAWSNPALLAGQETRGAVGLSGGSLFGGDLTGAGLGAGWLASPSWAVGVMAMSMGSTFPEVNGGGDETGTDLNRSVMAGGVGAAWKGSWLKAGMLVKVVSDNLAENKATAFGADVGAVGTFGDATVGLAGRNLGSGLRPAESEVPAQSLPGEILLGASYALRSWHALVGAEYAIEQGGGSRMGAGAEWQAVRRFAVRAGVQRDDAGQMQVTAGLSASYNRFSLDYAAVTHALGLNHRMSVSYGFGKTAQELAEAWASAKTAEAVEAAPAPAPRRGSKRNFAVADLAPQNVSAGDAAVISDMLRSELIRAGVFNVVEKQNMDKIMAEQAFQQTGCTNEGCAVKLGKLLNVQVMVVGSFGKLLTEYYVTIRAINVESGESVYAKTARAANVSQVEDAVKGVVVEMGKTLR